MKQEQPTCIVADDSKTEIEYTCFNSQCKFCRLLCQQCKIDASQKHSRHIANKKNYEIQHQQLKQSIRDAKFQIMEQYEISKGNVGVSSNDLKYVVIGVRQDGNLKILDYQNKLQIKAIQFNDHVRYVKFTDDSTILYVLTKRGKLYKYNATQQFKLFHTYQYIKDETQITNMYCVSNIILLTSSWNGYITKINVQQNKQLLQFKAHSDIIRGLDYDKNQNIIATADNSIKLWNANNGQLLIKQYVDIHKVIFIANYQLISVGEVRVIIWNINYQSKQLQQLQTVYGMNFVMQLVLHQQFIVSTFKQQVKIYSIDGEFIKKIDSDLDLHNCSVTDSMQECLLFGKGKQVILKIKLD